MEGLEEVEGECVAKGHESSPQEIFIASNLNLPPSKTAFLP